MKQCIRCGSVVQNNAEQFCPKCGGTKFKPTQNNQNGQPAKPQQPNLNKPQQPRPQQQRPQQNNGQQFNRNMQAPVSNQMNAEQLRNAGQNRANSQQNNMQSMQNQKNAQMNMTNQPVKLNKKQQQAKDMAMMNAMKQAQMSGQPFDAVAFENEWIAQNITNKQNNANTTASSGNETTFVQWMIALVISVIPIVGIVYSIMIMKNYSYSETRRNFHKAFLVYYIAAFIISLGITILINRM